MDKQPETLVTHLEAAARCILESRRASSHGPLDHFPGATKMVEVGV